MHRFLRHRIVIATILLGLLLLRPLASQAAPMPQNAPQASSGSGPDLIVESVTVNPPNPKAGDTADIIVTIKNIGDTPISGFFRYYLYINPTEIPPGQATARVTQGGTSTGLLPGETVIWTRTSHTFTQNGPQIYVWVDPPWENLITEANESNNLYPQGTPPPTSTATPVASPTATPTLTPSPTRTPGADSYEEDDRCASAKPISTDGVEQQHNLYRGVGADEAPDIDWVKFEGTSGVTYLIEAILADSGSEDIDMQLELHTLANCEALGLGSGQTITFKALQDDTYYVKAAHNLDEYGPATEYRLRITSDAGCVERFEPNNSCYAAGDLLLNTLQAHSYCSPRDEDWSVFQAQAGVTYAVEVNDTGERANSQLEIYESCDNVPANTSGQSTTVAAHRNGSYYVRTRQVVSTTYGAGTEHTLQVKSVGDATGCTPDAYEEDNNLDQASSLEVNGAAQQRNRCPARNLDFAKFTAQAGVTYTLETFDLGAASDTELCLRRGDNTTIVCDDDSGAGKGSRIVWQADAAGTYYLEVIERNPDIVGPDSAYTLRARTTTCDLDNAEPDNSRTTAKTIAIDGSLHERTICAAGDEDWFAFSAVANETYTLETVDVGPEADTILSLYDADGNFLAENDDYDPGVGSQLVHTAATSGTFYVRVTLYNGTNYGAGTEYKFRLQRGAPTATPTPTATRPIETATPTATPQLSAVKSLILVNLTQIERVHDSASSAALLTELERLAAHEYVQGQIIRLDQNSEVQAAYTEWNKPENWLKVDQANAVASRIRQVIQAYAAQHRNLQYVVLVGDDRALPFRRIYDNTPQQSENTYTHRDITNPTGAAQDANYFLSDNYYGALVGKPYNNRELYVPDLAVGRLIETPGEMINTIQRFIANPVTDLRGAGVLITGWDFVKDLAQQDCANWRDDLGIPNVVCIISESWHGDEVRAVLRRTDLLFKIFSWSGHANHFTQGVPDGQHIGAREIANLTMDLNGALAYSVACHSGLNVPETDVQHSLDIAQAFIGKGASYVGNTGYGWGLYYSLGLSEQLIDYYTRALVTGREIDMGTALRIAKERYYNATPSFTGYDEKVMQQLTFYGLPMQKIETGAGLGPSDKPWDEFDNVDFTLTPALDGIIMNQVQFNSHPNDWPAATAIDGIGSYYTLEGRTSNVAGEAIQPLHFGDVSNPEEEARSAVLTTGTYRIVANFTPVYASPLNEYTEENGSAAPVQQAAPLASPFRLRTRGNNAYLTTEVGDYDERSGLQYVYADLKAQVYYSNSTDKAAPVLTVVDGIYDAASGLVHVKVGASDLSGIHDVFVSYIADLRQPAGTIDVVQLMWDAKSQKWLGSFPGTANSGFIAQVVDNAGNMAEGSDKGNFHQVAVASDNLRNTPITNQLFLPLISR